MTHDEMVDELRRMAEKVADHIEDDEAAHAYEDELHVRALEMISEHSTSVRMQELADIALSTRGLDFQRVC